MPPFSKKIISYNDINSTSTTADCAQFLGILRNLESKRSEKEVACLGLLNLSKLPGMSFEIVRLGGHIDLISALDSRFFTQKSKEYSSLAISAISIEYPKVIVSAGGHISLIKLLKSPKHLPCTKNAGISALSNLLKSPENKYEIVKVGVIDALLGLLDRFNTTEVVKERVIELLADLTIDEANRKEIEEGDIVFQIVTVLRSPKSTQEAKQHALFTLTNLAMDEVNASAIMDVGGYVDFIDVLKQSCSNLTETPNESYSYLSSESKQVAEERSTQALGMLSRYSENTTLIVEAGAPIALIAVLRNPKSSDLAKFHATLVLSYLAMEPENSSEIIKVGGHLEFACVLKQTNSELGEKIQMAAALIQLSQNSESCIQMVKDEMQNTFFDILEDENSNAELKRSSIKCLSSLISSFKYTESQIAKGVNTQIMKVLKSKFHDEWFSDESNDITKIVIAAFLYPLSDEIKKDAFNSLKAWSFDSKKGMYSRYLASYGLARGTITSNIVDTCSRELL
jgi:hypothetical protein